ncbi:thioesterase II family protein [Aliamphritea hakodatensis]|uniref:thioesterase II family protein n=1 Tax=Aliamphritea hakodatensis TaxID=2895352 RepID=UPI0022FD7D9E|nr:alpha/beta fold hydrolase [Aliamphritea hakodatensis]
MPLNTVFKTLYRNGDRIDRLWIICPFAGGSLSAFRSWMTLPADVLPPDSAVFLVTYPGRDHRMRDVPASSIAGLAAEIAGSFCDWYDNTAEIQPQQVIICGHSMGAQVAYETCRLINSFYTTSSPVSGLVISACQAPHLSGRRLLSHLDDHNFIEQLSMIGGCSPALRDSPELLQLFLPMLRADFMATEGYGYPREASQTQRLNLPAVLLYGADDEEAWGAEVSQWQDWLSVIHQEPALKMQGDHFYISDSPVDFLIRVQRYFDDGEQGIPTVTCVASTVTV